MKHIKIRHTVDTVITYIIILAISLVFLFPILWLLLASFSRSGSLYSFDGFFPTEYSLDSFKKLFTDTALYNYPRWFGNTLFVASMSCLFGTALTILTAYCMSRYRFKSRKALMKTTLVLGMFPSFMAMTAVYLLMTQFNLINSHWGLILIYSAGAPMGYMTQKGFFDTIPKSIDEAERIKVLHLHRKGVFRGVPYDFCEVTGMVLYRRILEGGEHVGRRYSHARDCFLRQGKGVFYKEKKSEGQRTSPSRDGWGMEGAEPCVSAGRR